MKEAERAVEELGHRGLFISPHRGQPQSRSSGSTSLFGNWLSNSTLPALVHVSTGIRLPTAGAERFDRYSLFHLRAHPFEQMTAAAGPFLAGSGAPPSSPGWVSGSGLRLGPLLARSDG